MYRRAILSAIIDLSRAALPARSPMPLMVHLIWRTFAFQGGERIGDWPGSDRCG